MSIPVYDIYSIYDECYVKVAERDIVNKPNQSPINSTYNFGDLMVAQKNSNCYKTYVNCHVLSIVLSSKGIGYKLLSYNGRDTFFQLESNCMNTDPWKDAEKVIGNLYDKNINFKRILINGIKVAP